MLFEGKFECTANAFARLDDRERRRVIDGKRRKLAADGYGCGAELDNDPGPAAIGPTGLLDKMQRQIGALAPKWRVNKHVFERCFAGVARFGEVFAAMEAGKRQVLQSIAIGIVQQHGLGDTPGILTVDFLQKFRDGRHGEFGRHAPAGFLGRRDPGIFQNKQTACQESPEIGFARELGDGDEPVL